MDAEETLYRSNWEQYIGVLGGNMYYGITFHSRLRCSLIMAKTTWRVAIWKRHLYFFLFFVSPFELELFTACLLGMHAYIPCPFCCVTAEGVVHMPFTLPLLLLLCFSSYVP